MNTQKTLGQVIWESDQRLNAGHYPPPPKTLQQQVSEFNRAIGHPVPDGPTVPEEKIRINRINLIQEELDELVESMGICMGYGGYVRDEFAVFNILETIDAIADLLYVVMGAATDIGIDIQPFLDEVHRSNMSKIADGHRSESGKWIKGPGYSPADIKGVFKQNYPDYQI